MPIFFALFLSTILCPTTAQAMPTPPLIRAVQNSSMNSLVQLLRGGADINAIDTLGRTAAHYAVAQNNIDALEMLLDEGAEVNLSDSQGKTLLDLWQTHRDEDMLILLQKAGAAGTAQDLWQAAVSNDIAAAKRLLAEGADAQAKNAEGKVPFHVAVEAEHDSLAAILLKAAQGINGKDEKSWTPLMWAIVADDWDMVREFLAEGAYIIAGRQQSALDIAISMESEDKFIEAVTAVKGVDTIIENTVACTMLMLAAWSGRTETVKLLLEHGANIDTQNKFGWTALMWAAGEEKTETVKLLLKHGSNIEVKSSHGQTAIMLAAVQRETETVKLLLKHGANIEVKDSHGRTALMLAAWSGRAETVKLLLGHGANTDAKCIDGRTALMYAEAGGHSGHRKIAQLLREYSEGSNASPQE